MTAAPDYSIAEYVTRWAKIEAASASLDGLSLLDRLALRERRAPGFTEALLDDLGPEATTELAFDRFAWLRPKQIEVLRPTGIWRIILFIAGRRSGKTQAAAEWVIDRIEQGAREIAIVGPTYDDIKAFMVGGHKRRIDGVPNGSGILDLLPPWMEYEYREDEGVIELERCLIRLHSGEVPEFRGFGPDTVWCDEIIKWKYPVKLLSNLRLACSSVGKVSPQILITTSPKKSLRLLRDLVMEEDVLTITGSSAENRGNVDEGWFRSESRRLAGTSQGDEELGGKLGVEEDGAVFSLTAIDNGRVEEAPPLDRIVVAVDPAVSRGKGSDPTGINVSGRAGDLVTGHGYVLEDATDKHGWDEWGDLAWRLVTKHGASAIVVERDKIGDAGRSNIRVAAMRAGWEPQPRPGFKTLTDYVKKGRRVQLVEVLTRGVDKATRAEPVANMYTPTEEHPKGRIHHVGHHTELESEQTEWDPATGESPNAMDALVHAMTELFALDRAPEEDGRAALRGMKEANARFAPGGASGHSLERPAVDRERRGLGGLGGLGRGRFGGRLIG